MAPRERARLVVPVWGRLYAERFLGLTLPALLAPGNVPYLSTALDTEVVLVTQRDLFETLRGAEGVRKLEKHCVVRLTAMDDLMSFPAYYGASERLHIDAELSALAPIFVRLIPHEAADLVF